MEIYNESLRELLAEWVDFHHTHSVDQKQRELTASLLVPHEQVIIEELLEMRKSFDAKIRRMFRRKKWRSSERHHSDPSKVQVRLYPKGFCEWIRDRLWEVMCTEFRNPDKPGMQALRRFVSKGGVLKKVGGIQHKKFFQNGIQAGELWIDVANDTVDTEKPPIEINSLAESGFEDIDNFELCGDVLESYWSHKVYPNTVFPYLTPFYPIFIVAPNGTIQFLPLNLTMIAQNVLSGFRLAENFIFASRFSGEKLPPKYHHLIGQRFSWNEDVYDFGDGPLHGEIFYRGGAPKEMLADLFEILKRPEIQKNLARLIGEAGDVVRIFNQLNLTPRARSL